MMLGLSRTYNEEEVQKLFHEFKEHDASRNTMSIQDQKSLNLDRTNTNKKFMKKQAQNVTDISDESDTLNLSGMQMID